jgi:hypothetical protein
VHRSVAISSILVALVLAVCAMPGYAATIPCDKSRQVSPSVPLMDGTYGRVWKKHKYWIVQSSYRWSNAERLVVKVGTSRLDVKVKSFSIREAFYVCESGELKKPVTASLWGWTSTGRRSLLPLRTDVVPGNGLTEAASRGLWLTSRITIVAFDGTRSSLYATIRIRPPKAPEQ